MDGKQKPEKRVIVLAGPRCAGKSTVGEKLAAMLGLAFFDTDDMIAGKEGWPVGELIERDGWESFRLRETRMLDEAIARAGVAGGVISVGGGAVLSSSNRERMRKNALVVYLKAPLEVLAERMKAKEEREKRPSITGADPVEELAEVLEDRENYYRDAAAYIVDASPQADIVARTIADMARGAWKREA